MDDDDDGRKMATPNQIVCVGMSVRPSVCLFVVWLDVVR